MLAIFAIAYIGSAAVFYVAMATRAKEIPYPNWMWDKGTASDSTEIAIGNERAA